jgi:protocatechuate 4,5-dioxygenase beta chain
MARIVGGLATSHVPAIGGAMAKGLQKDSYWAPFFDGFPATHLWLDNVEPDAAVVIYNDHGLNFFLDKMPTFAVGAAPDYRNSDEGWGIPVLAPFKGDSSCRGTSSKTWSARSSTRSPARRCWWIMLSAYRWNCSSATGRM